MTLRTTEEEKQYMNWRLQKQVQLTRKYQRQINSWSKNDMAWTVVVDFDRYCIRLWEDMKPDLKRQYTSPPTKRKEA